MHYCMILIGNTLKFQTDNIDCLSYYIVQMAKKRQLILNLELINHYFIFDCYVTQICY